MKWTKASKYHLESECKQWIINKAFVTDMAVYTLVRMNPSRIVHVGTLAECKASATSE